MSSRMDSPAGARIQALLDPGSFVEIGAQVTARSTDFNMSEKKEPSDGVMTGYGQIGGKPVYLYSQDASVLGGTIGEMHAKKIVRMYELAVKTGAPVIGLIDCAGMRLEEAMDALDAFGQIYLAAGNASGVVPQILGVFGACGGGMALLPALSDFTFMEAEHGKLFVHAPNAIPENSEDKCDTASADYQSTQSGLADFVGTQSEIFEQMRTLVSILPVNNEDDAYDDSTGEDLNRLVGDAAACIDDPALLLPRLSDNNLCVEPKAAYGTDIVTAFIRLGGSTVGAVANRGNAISANGAKKAAGFVRFCDAFSIPVVTITNARSFAADVNTEPQVADAAARLAYAFSSASTAKINLITGEAFGSAGLVMNSRSIGADLVYAWPDAKCGMMEAKAAAKIMCDGADAAQIRETAAQYDELQNSIEAAAARGYVDAVIDPTETRKYLIGAVEMLYAKQEFRPKKKRGTV